MKPITAAQRKTFFINARKLGPGGLNRSRWLLKKMTGSTSVKKVTCWQMCFVLREQSNLIKSEAHEAPSLAVGGSIIQLLSLTQRQAIASLRARLSLDDEGFETMCTRAIKKSCPETYQDGEILIRFLGQSLTHRHRARLKKK